MKRASIWAKALNRTFGWSMYSVVLVEPSMLYGANPTRLVMRITM